LVFVREGEHFVGHVETEGFSGGPNTLSGEQHVYAAARTEVEHGLTRTELSQGGGIAAAERSSHGFLWDAAGLLLVVQIGSNRIARGGGGAFAAGSWRTAIRGESFAFDDAARRLTVFLPESLFEIFVIHRTSSATVRRDGSLR